MTRPSTPSSYQEAIFRFVQDGSGHGVIMATAGSGKSTTLVEVAHLLPADVSACFLAFNASAAKQLKDRLPEHVTRPHCPRPRAQDAECCGQGTQVRSSTTAQIS